tara:strand:+ start:361 stop:585 length:225 start_codon:yes stop_codon:yes gene_type:complete
MISSSRDSALIDAIFPYLLQLFLKVGISALCQHFNYGQFGPDCRWLLVYDREQVRHTLDDPPDAVDAEPVISAY